jgi:hypothetical protein
LRTIYSFWSHGWPVARSIRRSPLSVIRQADDDEHDHNRSGKERGNDKENAADVTNRGLDYAE